MQVPQNQQVICQADLTNCHAYEDNVIHVTGWGALAVFIGIIVLGNLIALMIYKKIK